MKALLNSSRRHSRRYSFSRNMLVGSKAEDDCLR